jgi:signal transduction histidine kinase
MSATSVSVVQSSRTARSPTRDPLSAYLLTAGVVAILAFLLIRGSESLIQTIQARWPELLFWTALVIVVNFVPVRAHGLRLTLDLPILLAVAFLYPPSVGALVSVLGAADARELTRQITISRAIFNRSQIALSVLLAGWVFHALAGGLEPWPLAVVGTAAALAVEYCINVSLVFFFLTSISSTGASIGRFSVGRPVHFLATYLGNGILALVLAHLFVHVGAWSVVAFLVPTLVARQALVRGQRLQELAHRLQTRERLLERVVDRAVDERHDERLRIAGDLHDDVLQSLTHMWLLAKFVDKRTKDASDSRGVLKELVESSEASIESLRNVIHDLKESPLARGGLIATLRLLARDLQLDWRVRIRVVADERVDLGPESQVIAYQVAREGVMNALKHARASEISVAITQGSDSVALIVEDDGVGFTAETADSGSHFGIGLMEERLRRVHGSLSIGTREGKGTRLLARLPLEPRPETE